MVSVQECLDHIRGTLGGRLSTTYQAVSILNQAGHHLVSMHEWLWCLRPVTTLDIRGDVTFSDGSSPTGSSVLTVSGASSYSFLEGDQVQLTGGTGVTAGYYPIVSQSGTAITVEGVIQSTGGTVTNIAGTIQARASRLPSDLRKILAVVPTNGLVTSFQFQDLTTINNMRSTGINVSALRFYGALAYGKNRTTNGGAPVPRLELYPVTQTNQTGVLKLTYLAGWRSIDSDQANVDIPDYVEPLYIQLVRAFARAYEEEDTAPLDVRLETISKGTVFKAARERDGETQASLGLMSGGAASERGQHNLYYIDTTVGGPP